MLFEKDAQHRGSYIEISNDPITQGTKGFKKIRCPAFHLFGFAANSQYPARFFMARYQGGFPDNDAIFFCINQSIGCSQVHAHGGRQGAEQIKHA